MTDPNSGTQKVETVDSGLSAYESPRLTLVGNLNDLLAGTGSANADDTSCVGTGTDPTPC